VKKNKKHQRQSSHPLGSLLRAKFRREEEMTTFLLRRALNNAVSSGAPTISSSSSSFSSSSSSKKQSLCSPLGRKSRKIFVSKNDDAKVNDDDEEEILSETTKRIAEQIASRRTTEENEGGEKAFGAGGQTTVDSLKRVDGIWKRIKSSEGKTRSVREFVKTIRTTVEEVEEGKRKFDVVVCGGTLGILLAATLQQKENNLKVGVIERGKLQGREQEWNVTRKELSVLCALNVLTEEDLDEVICGEFNPIKCGFYDSTGKRRQEENEIVTENVLNCGVSPTRLIEKCRENFELNGGVVFEETSLNGVTINEEEKHECARLDIGSETIEARLVVDAMGFGSPITLQARNGEKPDGVCVVVGTCAEGFDEAKNVSADLIYTCTDISEERQYFWEAFPAELDKKKKSSNNNNTSSNVRTTYMFSYLDAKPERPSIARILDDYWNLMPKYQNLNSLDDVEFKRILFGYFPTYRNSPLKAQFDRVLQIGDASGMQSPLSFGGLACMLRHLPRISLALTEALEADIVDKRALGTINAYQPALSAAWLFQRCMSVQVGSSSSPFSSSKTFINDLMRINFGVMQNLGDDVLKPFLQDVIRFKPLSRTLLSMTKNNIAFVPSILLQAGVEPIADWFRHFVALGVYDFLEPVVEPGMTWAKNTNTLSPRSKFFLRRYLEAIEYGAGNDSVDKEIQRRSR